MKKKTITTISRFAAFSFVFFVAESASAVKKLVESPTPDITSLGDFIMELLGIVVKIGVPVASIFLIWSGYLFVSAQGDTAKLATAKKTFVWACVGAAVLFGAWGLASAINGTIGALMK
jgi:hypothetical protein